jgi:hypothetical protein
MKMRRTAQLRRGHGASTLSADERRRAADERLGYLRRAILAGGLGWRSSVAIEPAL